MQTVLKQGYQSEVLLRKAHLITVGTKYPFKDQVVITTENTYQHPELDFSTYTHRIDVVIPSENRIEAMKTVKSLKEYMQDNSMMLPLHTGVFQKPWVKDNQKSRKHYAYTIDDAQTIAKLLPTFSKNNDYKYVVGATPVESNTIVNGFDLTYQIQDFRMEHLFMDTDFDGKPLETPFYRLSLYTSSIFETDDPKTKDITQSEELVVFHIKGDSESEIIALAKKLQAQQQNGKDIFTCKGSFPKLERDFYVVNLSKNASDLIADFNKKK